MNWIKVFGRKQVVDLIPANNIVLISISTPDCKYVDTQINTTGWADVLQLCFHDAVDDVEDLHRLQLFTAPMAQQLHDFIVKNKGLNIVVHCDGGMCRSPAVAAFVRDFFDYKAEFLGKAQSDQFRNIVVYNLLRRVHLGIKE